jgi:DNA polymerase-1
MLYVQSIAFSYFAYRQDPRFRVVTTTDQLEYMMNVLRPAKALAVDYETNGLEWWRDKRPCGVAFATQGADDPFPLNFYVPFRHVTGQPQLSPDIVIAAQKELLEDETKLKIAHNIKFEQHMSRVDGIRLRGPRVDTMIEARLYNEDAPAGLKERIVLDLNDPDGKLHEDMLHTDLVRLAKWRGMGIEAYRDLFGFSEMEIFLCGRYAAHDAYGTWELHKFYEQQGVRTYYSRSPRGPGFRGIYDIEMKLTDVLAKMEHVGQPLDIEYLKLLHSALLEEKEKAEVAFFMAFQNKCTYFNLSSDDQLRDFLLKGLKLKWDKYTKAGNLAVDYDVLSELSKEVPALEHALRFKEVEKKLSTYTLAMVERADDYGILHGDFQQVGTNTGRLSCKQPNLQNLASDDADRAKSFWKPYPKESWKSALAADPKVSSAMKAVAALAGFGCDPESVKRAFVVHRRLDDPYMLGLCNKLGKAPKLFRMYWDYSQIELRVLADYTRDERLVKAYLEDKDIHDEVERAVFGTGTEYGPDGKKIDGPNRRKAKVINFGLSYCMSPIGFVRQIKEVTPEEAEHYFNEYNKKFPGVPAFRQKFWSFIRMNKCQFDNKFGRTRHVPGIVANDQQIRKRNERQAIATLIQGTAAELTKQSLVLLDEYIEEKGLLSRLSQTIHDEIQIDGPVAEFADMARTAKKTMEDYPDFCVPIKVDGKWSIENWIVKSEIPGLK